MLISVMLPLSFFLQLHARTMGWASILCYGCIIAVSGIMTVIISYADVLDSGKGWAAVVKFNPGLLEQFEAFRGCKDTFLLGVCNGCQFLALLGWVPGADG